jgi:hypothetical protein
MFGSISSRLPQIGTMVLGAAFGLGSAVALAQADQPTGDCSSIQFEMANPPAGSRVEPGNLVVQGIAFDTRAETGTGIDSVDFFLGNRETGGTIIGHPVPLEQGPLEANSFITTLNLPNTPGGQELFGYAHSSVTGDESILTFPIAIGVDPARAGDLMTQPAATTCAPTSAATAAPEEPQLAAEPVEQPGQMPAGEAAMAEEQPATSQLFLDVGNPSPGDTIHVGGLIIEGIAFDRAADESPGIDHIDVFIDDRDAGGMLIGHGTLGAPNPVPDDPALAGSGWNAEVMLSNRMTGPHTLFFYALSAATGEEIVVTIPVQVVP